MLRNIGRFEILETLGKGAQSIVYLGFDPHLQREVAIKTLHFARQDLRQNQMLIQEARTVSKLQHPNIVPIFEAGEHEGDPYLVFEYVEGKTLAEVLKEDGALPVNRAINLITQVLDAIAHAQRHDIIHRDLKPSNILISREGLPRVMDFGIAMRISDDAGPDTGLTGTPAYMAPEYISTQTVTPQSDIFAAGLILYEMLTGKRAVQGRDLYQILDRLVSGPLFSASELGEFIDEKLGDIILKSLAPNPLDRYGSPGEMREALEAYLTPNEQGLPQVSEESKKSTLEFLLRRMRHKSDFPALSESVSAINKIVASEQESIAKLSNTILKDFALTNKILKLVNSAFYTQYGGGAISTITRAVVILGFDAVRNIAITLMLFEHLQNKAHAAHLKDEFIRTLFSGVLAKGIAARNGEEDAEEAFICAMFHNLGRLLSMFYFPEETEEIKKRMLQKGYGEEAASTQVLGLSFQELGVGIARIWGFPDQIVFSMRNLPDGPVRRPASDLERMRILSAFANDVSAMIESTPREKKAGEIRKLATRFGEHMPVEEKELVPVLDDALKEVVQYANVIHLNLHQSHFGKQLSYWLGRSGADNAGGSAGGTTVINESVIVTDSGELKTTGSASVHAGEKLDTPAILTAGIQDISNSLVEGVSLNDILRMIMETMYRSMGFQRVLLCIKDGRQNVMSGRFGFGQDINQIARNFKFPLSYTPDVFHAAITRNVDILISDIDDPKIQERIPDWYRKMVTAQTFVLFPLTIKNVPVALIYADKEVAGEIRFTEKELSLLRTLRNQAVLAIKQST